MENGFFRRCFRIVVLPFMVTTCTMGPDFERPKPPEVSSYVKNFPASTLGDFPKEEENQYFDFGEKLRHDWWTLFESPRLNILIEKALSHSPTLIGAEAAIRQAQENVSVFTGNNLYPSLDLSLGVERQKSGSASYGIPGSSTTFTLWNPSLNVSYAFDFFGGQQRQIESLMAEVDYQRFLWESAHLRLISTLITSIIQEASLGEQISIVQRMIDVQTQILEIIKSQLKIGAVSETEVLGQETLLTEIQRVRLLLQKQLSHTSHSISALVGEFPEETQRPLFTFKDLKLPQSLPIHLPSTLVRMRPDIKASEALLKVQNANIGLAEAHFFPTLTLTGTAETMALSTQNVLANSATVWSLGGALLQPLFRGGALSAQKRAADALYDQAFAIYRQTVLAAFQEVADVLRAIVLDAQNFQLQTQAQEKSLKALIITQNQFKLGGTPYLSVLNSEMLYLESLLSSIAASALRLTDTVALFQALGGGWKENLPQTDQTIGQLK